MAWYIDLTFSFLYRIGVQLELRIPAGLHQ